MEGSIAEFTKEEEKREEEKTEEEKTEEENSEEEKKDEDDVSDAVHQKKNWKPNFYCNMNKEIYYFAGHEIRIYESLDSYGAIIWPAGVALCQYLDSNRRTINLQDKAVLELGAGTGLVSIVASLLGAWVTASDLSEVLGNLQSNLCRNTRGYCRYTPQVAELSWGYDLDKTFPQSVYRYDYILAADVVYHHNCLDELLVTMRHFCQQGTTLVWANKIRFASDLVFIENFKKTFNTELLADLGEIQIYSATKKNEVEVENCFPGLLLEDAAKQEIESEECNFGNDSKKEAQYTDEEGVKSLNRESEQRNVNTTEEKTKYNCEEKHKEESQDVERNKEPAVLHRSCSPSMEHKPIKDIYNFLGYEICIENSIGDLACSAEVALCKFLETPAGREKVVLLDRTVLELHAGTGLLSIVAMLLGAKVTATGQPESLENLTNNLHQNTRGHLRHTPQVTALTQDLEQNVLHSKCHYDYVLAAEALHRHDCFAELLVIMRHFCQPGTNLIWAIKMCSPSDLLYINDFNKAFHSTMLAELDRVRIYLATRRDQDNEDDLVKTTSTEEKMEKCPSIRNYTVDENPTGEKTKDCGVDSNRNEGQCQESVLYHQKVEDEQEEDTEGTDSNWEESGVQSESESISTEKSDEKLSCRKFWESSLLYTPSKEIYYFMGHKIIIEESFDSYGAMIWPAAVALCKFLETTEGRQQIDLLDKTVLEIGAGTGLLSIVITLLDLPEILSNLRYNLNRNTRLMRRHEPQVKELSWGYEVEKTFPRSLHHYEYVLAADVVYHHSFLNELLATMQHFCRPGTTVILANKIRYPSDLTFLENFENIFHATLLAELDEVRIYSATYKSS
ncbi:Protein-lysine methyltransferase METTL21C [Bagarius yarrelli]|uniref:Protein-lysine methyltransferase METTL21C n=1 Tax=Bagarius yarrelli TaxID=175774 RepID=A0A556TKD7_BAGYA|nr:Protein-lysine methyltransferase METTL21C [Bagarius yarrelli]